MSALWSSTLMFRSCDKCCMCAGRKPGKPTFSLKYSSAPFGFAVSRANANASTPPLFNTDSFPIIFKVSPQAWSCDLTLEDDLTSLISPVLCALFAT